MSKNKESGDIGEQEIIDLISCPNCGKKLMTLPRNYPLYDVQCMGCSFRAQVKTNRSKPKKEIFGAGWEVINKVLKSGFLIPSLITNFKWEEKSIEKQEIRFYPFITKNNLRKRLAKIKKNNRRHWMFNYMRLDKLPHFILYKK